MLVHYERQERDEKDIEHLTENPSDSDDSVNDTELDDKPPISSTLSMAQLESFD